MDNKITMYSLYDCDEWRSTASMSVIFETLSLQALNDKIKELLTEDDTYLSEDDSIDIDNDDLAESVACQEINCLYLEKRIIDLNAQTVELC